MSNLYEVLGLGSDAQPEQVKAAFHRLAKSSHPDVNAGDETAAKRFREVNQAYEILSNPERRTVYDLGLVHKRPDAHRLVRHAMAASVASFMVTVGCGLYIALRSAPQPKQDSPRLLAEVVAKAGSQAFKDITHPGPASETPVPQLGMEQPHQDAPPAASSADKPKRSMVSAGVQRQTAVTKGSLGMEASILAEAKTMGVAPPAVSIPVASQVERERVLRLYAQGLQQIEIGNVYAARQFFELAANAGLCRSAVALAGMYDPVRLAKLKVLGGQPDFEAAVKWYKKAHDLCAIDALRPKWAIREEGEFLTKLALAVEKPAGDSDLTQFRAAFTSGDGLAYVVIKDEKGEHIYRYGDQSRLMATKGRRVYKLYTCNTPHVFVPQKAEDNAALQRATVVKLGDPRFSELDAKYLSGCDDPLVRSAIPNADLATVGTAERPRSDGLKAEQ
jgi:DnaJ domain